MYISTLEFVIMRTTVSTVVYLPPPGVSPISDFIIVIVDFTVDYNNNKLSDYDQCAKYGVSCEPIII